MKLPFYWLLPNVEGIPILMYHRVSPFQSDRLTVPVKNIRDQFSFLAEPDYRVISIPHFLDALTYKATLPEKVCLLTFV